MHFLRSFTWLNIASGLVVAHFISPPSNDTFQTVNGPLGLQTRFKAISTGPGSLCEQNPDVVSYSGFVDMSPHKHVFFWFFGARDIPPEDAPLTAWISGGPGDSSMFEVFAEIGPCRLDYNLSVHDNPYSWNRFSNVVFIDQPVTVGFSYTDAVPAKINQDDCTVEPLKRKKKDNKSGMAAAECPVNSEVNQCDQYGDGICGTMPDPAPRHIPHSTSAAAKDFYKTLQGIYAAFPQFTKHAFHFGSESYGGHYVPIFSEYIVQQNDHLPKGARSIPIASLLIHNGWYDPALGYKSYYEYLIDPGNPYDVRIRAKNASSIVREWHNHLYGKGECLDQLAKCNSVYGTDDQCSDADDYCDRKTGQYYSRYLGRDQYDIREIEYSPFPPSFELQYLNQAHVQKELGVFTNYTEESVVVEDLFYASGDDGKDLGIVAALSHLLDHNISIAIINGDADSNCNWLNGQAIADRVISVNNGPDASELQTTYRDKAGFENITTPEGVVHGVVKQAGLFSFVRMYYSGHQVPFFQPLADQTIFDRVVSRLDVATGKVLVQTNTAANSSGVRSIYASTGPRQASFHEGNGTVQYKVLPDYATYNTTTNAPNPVPKHAPIGKRGVTGGSGRSGLRKRRSRGRGWAHVVGRV